MIFSMFPCTAFNFLNKNFILQQQIRTTFILKRQVQPLLYKKNQRPKKMRGRHFIYDLVEDTCTSKQNNIEVILKTFVDGIGKKGEILSLKPTFAYNKLLLPGLAVYKTEENLEKYSIDSSNLDEEQSSSPYVQKTVKALERLVLSVTMNKYEPWVIKPWHIRVSLRKIGVICPEDCIILPETKIEGPDINGKEGKIFYCTIVINNKERARLTCRIHHWTSDPTDRLPFIPEFWKVQMEPLYGTESSLDDYSDKKTELP